MIRSARNQTCLSSVLVWGAWYLQSRLGRRRRLSARAGIHSRSAWRVPLLRRRRAGDLCRKGQEPALPAELLLRRSRLPAEPHSIDGQTAATKVDWTVVHNEVEALQLEYSWIKEFDPRFNIKYRDDKSYPWLAVTVCRRSSRGSWSAEAPSAKGTRYFGPYSHAWAIRETVDLLLRVFPMRSCRPGVFKNHKQLGRPCLLGLHRQMLGALHRPGERRGASGDRRRLLPVHVRPGRPDDQEAGAGDARRPATPWSSSARLGCGTISALCNEPWSETRSSSETAPTPTSSPSPRIRSRSPYRSSMYAAAACAASAAGSPTGSTTGGSEELIEQFLLAAVRRSRIRRPTTAMPCPARSWCR